MATGSLLRHVLVRTSVIRAKLKAARRLMTCTGTFSRCCCNLRSHGNMPHPLACLENFQRNDTDLGKCNRTYTMGAHYYLSLISADCSYAHTQAWTSCGAGSYVSVPGTLTTDRSCVDCPTGKLLFFLSRVACFAEFVPQRLFVHIYCI